MRVLIAATGASLSSLDSAVNAEAFARAASDANLQSQIDGLGHKLGTVYMDVPTYTGSGGFYGVPRRAGTTVAVAFAGNAAYDPEENSIKLLVCSDAGGGWMARGALLVFQW